MLERDQNTNLIVDKTRLETMPWTPSCPSIFSLLLSLVELLVPGRPAGHFQASFMEERGAEEETPAAPEGEIQGERIANA